MRLRVLGIGIFFVAACSGGADAPVGGAGSDPHTFAVLYGTREQVLGSLPAQPPVELGVGARVVRYDGIDRTTVSEVLELAAFEADDVPPGECSAAQTAATIEDIGGLDGGAIVELLDVGAFEVRGPSTSRLEARSFPDLLSVVSGVVYAGVGRPMDPIPSGSEMTFAAEGGDGVGAIEVSGQLPEELAGLRVGQSDPWLGAPTLVRGSELEIEWEAGDAADEIRIDLEWIQPAGAVVVTCRATDEGRFVVPAASTRLVPELDGAGDPRMTVRRVRRTAVAASGLEDGELVLQQVTSFPLRAL